MLANNVIFIMGRFTYAPEILSGIIVRISASSSESIASDSESFLNLIATYPRMSSSVGFTEDRSGYPGKYFFTSTRMCGLPVMNSRIFGHSRTTCCKESQSSGRCFVGNSSSASMQINPRRNDETDLMSIVQISESRGVLPSTFFFARSKASLISSGIGSTPATSCLKRAAKMLVADCRLCS